MFVLRLNIPCRMMKEKRDGYCKEIHSTLNPRRYFAPVMSRYAQADEALRHRKRFSNSAGVPSMTLTRANIIAQPV